MGRHGLYAMHKKIRNHGPLNPASQSSSNTGPAPSAARTQRPSALEAVADTANDGRQRKWSYARKTVTVPQRRLQPFGRASPRACTPDGPVASRLRGHPSAPLEKRSRKRARTVSSSPEPQRGDEAARRAKRGCRRWRCPYCKKEFSVKDTLNTHILGKKGSRAQPPCWKFREVERANYLQRRMPKAPIWIGGARDGGDVSVGWSKKCKDRGVHLWHTDATEAAAYGGSGRAEVPPAATHRTVATQTPWRVVIVEEDPVVPVDMVEESGVVDEADDMTFKQRLHFALHI